jgi:branched-chain amino acid transport system permease protein
VNPVTLPTIISWLTYSSLLSMMALGVTLLYRTTKVANFAHASLVTSGAYVAYSIVVVLHPNPYLGVPLAFAIVGGLGLLLFYGVLEPMRRRHSTTVMLMVATLAFDIVLFGILNILADYLASTYFVPSRNILMSASDFTFAGQPGIFFVAVGILSLCSVVLYFLLNFTTLGMALRASMENSSLAQAIGVNVTLMLAISWFAAGGLAGVSGALLPMWTQVNPNTGTVLLASMFCASIVGGLDEIYGAVLGGFLLGFVDVVGTSVLASSIGAWIAFYEPAVPLVVLAATLILAPKGLAGFLARRRK